MLALIAGATGFVGSRLAPALLDDGLEVRCLVRDPGSERAGRLEALGCELVRADLAGMDEIGDAFAGVGIAYFLVHMMGRRADYAGSERRAAARFAGHAREAGVGQLIYLGGLGAGSPHLRSRHETAMVLREEGPPLTYFRAAMVVGSGSESYVLVRDIAERLPAIPDAAWMQTLTQPIGIRDVIAYLRRAPFVEAARAREIEIGGPEAITPFDVVDRHGAGARPPPAAPPTGPRRDSGRGRGRGRRRDESGDGAIAAQLALGLGGDTIVRDPSGAALFDVRPEPLDVTLQRAIEDDEQLAAAAPG